MTKGQLKKIERELLKRLFDVQLQIKLLGGIPKKLNYSALRAVFREKRGQIRKQTKHPKDPLYEKWRTNVYRNDNYTCQMCGKTDMQCHAHHIYSQGKYPKLKYLAKNGITLCPECHLTEVHKLGKTCKAIEEKARAIVGCTL